MEDEMRTVDTAWLRAAIGAIEEEFNHRLKLDDDFAVFAETLEGLHSMTEEFMGPRMDLLDEEDR